MLEDLLQIYITDVPSPLCRSGVCTHQPGFATCLEGGCHQLERGGDIANALPGDQRGRRANPTCGELIMAPVLIHIVFLDVWGTRVCRLKTFEDGFDLIGRLALVERRLHVHRANEGGGVS